MLTHPRLAVLTFSTKNEAGLASVKRTASERSPLEANTLMQSYIQDPIASPIHKLTAVGQRHTESYALSLKYHMLIEDQGLLILRIRNNPTCMEPRHTRLRPPLILSLMSLFQLSFSHLTSWSLNTTAHSATPSRSPSRQEHKRYSTWLCLQNARRSKGYSPSCAPSFAMRVTPRSICEAAKAPTHPCRL